MAKRQKVIHVESSADYNVFRIYSDLHPREFERIQGVMLAESFSDGLYHKVTIDPRYDIQEVIEEIKAFALKNSMKGDR